MSERQSRKQLEGLVTSDKMEKTVVVEIVHRVVHPVYKKYVKRTVRYKAHDAENQCRVGLARTERLILSAWRPSAPVTVTLPARNSITRKVSTPAVISCGGMVTETNG